MFSFSYYLYINMDYLIQINEFELVILPKMCYNY